MSHKSQTFVPTYLKTSPRSNSEVAKHVTRKTGSYAPPPQWPGLGMGLADARAGLESISAQGSVSQEPPTAPRPADTVAVELNLTQLVALVSACLAAADAALVNASRWELLHDDTRAQLYYARSVMLESTAEQLAKSSRQSS